MRFDLIRFVTFHLRVLVHTYLNFVRANESIPFVENVSYVVWHQSIVSTPKTEKRLLFLHLGNKWKVQYRNNFESYRILCMTSFDRVAFFFVESAAMGIAKTDYRRRYHHPLTEILYNHYRALALRLMVRFYSWFLQSESPTKRPSIMIPTCHKLVPLFLESDFGIMRHSRWALILIWQPRETEDARIVRAALLGKVEWSTLEVSACNHTVATIL